MNKQVAIIGAGIAGLEAASILDSMGFKVTLVEKAEHTGGHIQNWHQLFPDRRNATEVAQGIISKPLANVSTEFNREVTSIQPFAEKFIISAKDGWVFNADAVLITTGFELFDAKRKEEYGYGIYDHVITSAELESLFKKENGVTLRIGRTPSRIGLVHCVGSRDEKIGNIYCSKVCCVTAVKQAIELKELYPECEIYCLYMDLRMSGRHYEELYKQAQEEYSIQFIRGRLSEAAEDKSGRIIVKVEDTLLGRPLKMTMDMLVLMTGMVASAQTASICSSAGIQKDSDGFFKASDPHLYGNITGVPGIFVAGTCSGPKTISDTLSDARSAALAVQSYLSAEANN